MARAQLFRSIAVVVLDYDIQHPTPLNLTHLLVLGATGAGLLGLPEGLNAQRTAPATPVSAPITNIRYDVTFNRTTAAQRSLRVSMTFNVANNEPVLLSMPAWTPGCSEISDCIR